MLKKIRFPAFLLCLLISVSVSAQLKTRIYEEGIPISASKMSVNRAAAYTIPEPTLFNRLLKEKTDFSGDAKEYKDKFAMPVPVNISLLKEAVRWEEKNTVYYALSVVAERALNLALQFDKFHLSPNARLSIFNDFEITDDVTASENNDNNIWATRIYQGGKLNLLLHMPVDEEGKTIISIGTVGLGFKEAGGVYFGKPGQSATCNINVVCPQGNGWNNERNAVALIVSNSSELCTGTLVMNTCSNNRPYLLTANHCLNGNVANWVFQFFTFSVTCTPNGTYRQDMQFNGCQLRANNAATDFALVELNQTPAAGSGLNYAGWNRSATPATSTTGLHHPRGDLMKVSNDFQAPVAITWAGAGGHWRAAFDQGVVQFGSSGSALFDQNHRIVGQLHGNQANICSAGDNNCWCVTQIPAIGEYGRFDLSWTGGGTAATRLSDWLDPSGSGVTTTNTTNISSLLGSNLSISGKPIICNSEVYSVTGLPAGATVVWSIPGSAGTVLLLSQNTPSANQLTITNRKWYSISTTLTATITTPGCPPYTRTLQVANDNSTSASSPFQYFQESCYFYNVYHSSMSGTMYSNSSPLFVHQGCMVYVNLGNTSGLTVTSTGATPMFWAVGPTSYYANTLYFQLPLGSGGIPFTFKISGGGACYEKTLLFFSISNNGRYSYAASPNPVKNELLLDVKANTAAEQKTVKPGSNNMVLNIYDFNTNRLQMTLRRNNDKARHRINTSGLKPGYYVLQIVEGDQTQSLKFYKE